MPGCPMPSEDMAKSCPVSAEPALIPDTLTVCCEHLSMKVQAWCTAAGARLQCPAFVSAQVTPALAQCAPASLKRQLMC